MIFRHINYTPGIIPRTTKKTEIPFSVGASFHDHLDAQLGLRKLDEHEHALADYIIGNIDEDGYLRREIEAIADDLAFSLNVNTTEEELLNILRIIQDFDPVGVGARDLRGMSSPPDKSQKPGGTFYCQCHNDYSLPFR
jgi:DNA-directed RNA polymerase specialized sigma54-like protein